MALVSGLANRPILPPGWVPVNHVSGHTFQETTVENWDYNYNPINRTILECKHLFFFTYPLHTEQPLIELY